MDYLGLGCPDCSGTCGGKGLGTIDISTWTGEDWLLVGMLGMGIYAAVSPGAGIFNPKPKRKRKSKGSGTLGSITAAAVVLGVAYFGFQYVTTGNVLGGGSAS